MPNLIFGTVGAAKVLEEQEKMNRKVKVLAGLYKEDVREAKNLERAAKKIYTSLQTPQEKVLKQIRTIAKAHKEGFIDRPQARQGVERLRKKLVELNKVQDKTKEKGKQTFDVAMVASIGASIAAALKFKEILTSTNQLLDEQAQKQKTAAPALGKLAQLAGGDKVKLNRLIAATEATFAEGAFRTVEESAGLTFELESANVLKERQFFSLLETIEDSAKIAGGVALVKTGFEGGDKTGTGQQILAKSFAAAKSDPRVSPSGILDAVAEASSEAKKLGLTDEELFASVSRIGQVTGSASEAGKKAESLFVSLANLGFGDPGKQQPLFRTLEQINARGLLPSELKKSLGRKEAVKAFDILGGDIGQFTERTGEIKRAESSGVVIAAIKNALSQELIAAPRLSRAAAAQKELALSGQSSLQLAGQSRADLIFARRVEQGDSLLGTQIKDFLASGVNSLTGGAARRIGGEKVISDFQRNQLDLLESMKDSQEKQLEEQKETNRKLTGRGLIGVAQ